MKKHVASPRSLGPDFDRRADKRLAELQAELLPEHESELVAIDVESGEYLLASTKTELWQAARRRWPDRFLFLARLDGQPTTKFHGK